MSHSTRRLLSMGMGWILVWTALVAVPPQALAGSRAGYDIITRPPQVSTRTAPIKAAEPVKAAMTTACQNQCQAMSTALDALRTRAQVAREANDPVQMRAVLDEVLQQTAMQDHMPMCMQMMGMMQSMHGGMAAPRQGQ